MIKVSRVKVNLANGSVLDKPVITSFKGTNGDYLILDNETNGSMGLPIICVCKINGTELSKIVDPTEWNAVKDNLKTIIAGTNLPYLSVPDLLSASDDFYTQLTLPVASFDLLKNVYSPTVETPVAPEEPAPASVIPDVPAVEPAPVMQPNVLGSPMMNTTPTPVEVSAPSIDAPVQTMPDVPVMPDVVAPVQIANPVETTPVSFDIPSMVPPVDDIVSAPVNNNLTASPMNNTGSVSIDYDSIKANFMSACENMVDGLIDKLKNQDK